MNLHISVCLVCWCFCISGRLYKVPMYRIVYQDLCISCICIYLYVLYTGASVYLCMSCIPVPLYIRPLVKLRWEGTVAVATRPSISHKPSSAGIKMVVVVIMYTINPTKLWLKIKMVVMMIIYTTNPPMC